MPVISATRPAWASTRPISSAFCSPVEASRAGDALRRVDHGEVGEMRPVERAAGGGVARAIVAQHRAIAVLDLDRRHGRAPAPRSSRRARSRRTERRRSDRCAPRARRQAGCTASARAAATATASSAVSCSIASSQCGSGCGFSEQPVARAQRAFERVDPRAVLGVDRQHQPVEEAPPLARPARRTGRPSPAPARATRRWSAKAAAEATGSRSMRHLRAARVVAGRRLDAGAERREPERALDLGRHRPGAVALAEGDLVERGAAQAAPGREQRDRFEQVGLAGAVRADEHDRRRRAIASAAAW